MSSLAEQEAAALAPPTGRIVVPEGMGKPTPGPSALGTDWRRLWRLSWTLAINDFKLKFFGSALGYLWQLLRPLLLFGVLYVVFSTVFKFSSGVKFYPVALLLGIVLYGFFSEVTSQGVRSLVQRESLVRRVEFPRLAVPLSTTITGLLNVVLNLVPVYVFLLVSGGKWHRSWLQMPFLVALLGVFCFGMAMLLSALYVRFRDIEPAWDVVLQMLFYASPIFYPIERVIDDPKLPDWLAKVMLSNPLAAILQQARHALIDPSHPSASKAMGGAVWLAIPAGIAVLLLLFGYRAFLREAPRVAEDL
jgi:ABC-2 type transport system permease protein